MLNHQENSQTLTIHELSVGPEIEKYNSSSLSLGTLIANLTLASLATNTLAAVVVFAACSANAVVDSSVAVEKRQCRLHGPPVPA